LIFYKFALLCH